jgi:Uma2 family endonuclease
MAITGQRLTLEEFLGLPEEKPALEFHAGVVTQKMAPGGDHSAMQGALFWQFDSFAKPRKLARAFPELRTTFAGSSFVPDLAVYGWERIPADERGRIPSTVRTPPDIAVEIISPGQARADLVDRCRWYVEHGVQVALLVDPRRLTVEVFRRGARALLLRPPDRIDLGDVIPDFEIPLDALFASLMAR